jgi:uncharacterized protein YybS (DUF2232 family)
MSFDNLSNNKIKKLNLALLALFTFLSLVIVFIVPFIGIIGLAILPIPATLLVISGRIRDAIISAVLGVILLFFLNYILAIIIIIIIIAVSFSYKFYIEQNKSIKFIIVRILIIFLAAGFLYIVIVSAVNRVNFIRETLNSYNNYIDNISSNSILKDYAGLMMVDSVQFESVLSQTQYVMRFIPYLLPGIFIVCLTSIGIINYQFSHTILKKYDTKIKPLPLFKNWDIPWYWCWGIILGLILILIPSFNSSIDKLIDVVGFNLLIIFGMLYFVLGVSVSWGLFERFKIGMVWRVVILIVISLFMGLIIILPIMGLFDTWINFRRLKRK